jgi:NADH-quinone oxidoreductase subunit J
VGICDKLNKQIPPSLDGRIPMTFELILFILVAAVAIFAAAMMLVSRNAVHGALFLVLNFLCVALLYLMLDAPFLSMIQVTVYAGAIMVLFMFVIMLLGAERLGGAPSRYPWIAGWALVLTGIFLVIAFIAITRSGIGLLQPVPAEPDVQFVHAVPDAPAVDVYLNNELVAERLEFREPTEFEAVNPGNYNLLVYPACEAENRAECVDPIAAGVAPTLAVAVELQPAMTTTFVIAGSLEALRVITVPVDLSTLTDESTVRMTAVNAYPEGQPINVLDYNESIPSETQILMPAIPYGGYSNTVIVPEGEYTLQFQQGGEVVSTLRDYETHRKTHELLIFAPELPAGTETLRPMIMHLEPVRTAEAFGSPQAIGLEMLTTFLLPFELVSLLLLAAMVGAIIITREETVRRERRRVVVSQAVRRINTGQAAVTTQQTGSATSATSTPSAEPSAD